MKQKHWQVSVFDKASEAIKNETFYTTDTEAYLVFELIDEDFTPDSATITVYNIYGKATINANVEVADGIVRYEIPEEAIGHPGGWRTQVIFTKDSEDYTTGILEFDVGGHLLDNKKPAIVDIENWNSFIAHAGELIYDWEQLEEIRQANETSRQTNELVREEAELARETAETVRVENEVERISKDSERDSKIEALDERLEENEEGLEQHKLDYVEEISKKANKQQEEWITPTLLNEWEFLLSGYEPFGYMKDEFGRVHFKGIIRNGLINQIAFMLPAGYRPAGSIILDATSAGAHASVIIANDGNLRVNRGANGSASFSGLSFPAFR